MAAKKRSVAWSFFQEHLSTKRVVCLLCAENIQHCGNTTNMLKHLRSKHQEELTNAAKRRRLTVDDDSAMVRQLRPEEPLRDVDGISENDAEIHMPEMAEQPTEQEPLEEIEETGRASVNGSFTLSVTKTRKRSAVWSYYQDGLDPNKVLCLVCSENINYPQNTSNLLRHLRKKHPGEYGDIEGSLKERSGEKAGAVVTGSLAEQVRHNGITDNSQVIQITGQSEGQEHISSEETCMAVADIVDEAYCSSLLPTKKRSAVWSYYERGEDATKVLCLLCSEHIHYRQNTSNLLRHLRKKHSDKYIDKKRKALPSEGLDVSMDHGFKQKTLPIDYRSTGAPAGFVEALTVEHSEQMKKTMEQETRALERERELTEQLRRAQQQEARALEQQRELTEQLRRAQEQEMKRIRELETRALEQERKGVEQLRKEQEQEAKAIEREREALEQLKKELEEDRKALQRQWDALRQGRVTVVGEEIREQALSGLEGGEVEMLVVSTQRKPEKTSQ
ncbi:hypothetical protein SKAU_G00389610 [Synaphobranchus kaupii]|uniref:BED-type domain-containing protein n=1 Tax=Synaphobranchus kaupii TaxID=118154 RepID=A0A9Q1EB99_SYNKA|nr:hypothetical protein SKAU_G00389610 [Synaphobranchus kaupii]